MTRPSSPGELPFMKLGKRIVVVWGLLVVGCGPSITNLGDGKYVTTVTRQMYFGKSSAPDDAIQSAHEHCATQGGGSAEILDTDLDTSANDSGRKQTATVTFTCN